MKGNIKPKIPKEAIRFTKFKVGESRVYPIRVFDPVLYRRYRAKIRRHVKLVEKTLKMEFHVYACKPRKGSKGYTVLDITRKK